MHAVNILVVALAWVALGEAGVLPTTTHPGVIEYNYKSGGKYYKLHTTAATWSRAQDICRQNGAVLPFPETKKEKVFLDVIRNITRIAEMWVGAYTTWRTVKESPYFNSLEPEKIGVVLTENRMQATYDPEAEFPFICELTSFCNTSAPGYELGPDGRSCYKLSSNMKTWIQSATLCKIEGAHLAIANSQEEAHYLSSIMARPWLYAGIHSGFHDLGKEGEFITLDGPSLVDSGYAVWSEDELDSNYHCGHMFQDGKLGVRSCENNMHYFICEGKPSILNYIPLELP